MSNCIQLKTSVIKDIKKQLLNQFPDIESWLNHIMPKKDPVKIVRWYDLKFSSSVFHTGYLFPCFQWMMSISLCFSLPAMSTLKSWQWMESCFSSDRETDHSIRPSDCCINVNSSNASLLTVYIIIFSHWSLTPFSFHRSLHSSSPASRQRSH